MENKIVYTCVLYVSLCVHAFSQSAEKTSAQDSTLSEELKKQEFIYNLARRYNDPIIERMALYNMIAQEPSFMIFHDSLVMHYYKNNEWASAALLAQQISNVDPDNLLAAEIAAETFSKLGVKEKAIRYYEKLYLSINDINILYKMAFLQYELERYAQSNTSLNIIIGDSTSNDQMISFPTVDGEGQEVSLRVGAFRIKAMIEEAKGNTDEAIEGFLEVLKMHPNFQIVQQQLREMKSKKEE